MSAVSFGALGGEGCAAARGYAVAGVCGGGVVFSGRVVGLGGVPAGGGAPGCFEGAAEGVRFICC